MRFHWQIFAAVLLLITTPSSAEEVANEAKPQADTDLLALMSGRCSILNVAGRDFACKTVAWAHSTHGRAYFTIALDDPADHARIIVEQSAVIGDGRSAHALAGTVRIERQS